MLLAVDWKIGGTRQVDAKKCYSDVMVTFGDVMVTFGDVMVTSGDVMVTFGDDNMMREV